jgi:hypothetical protein
VTDAEDEIRICERFAEQGLKRSRVGAEADAKIDVRRDHAHERTLFRRGRQFARHARVVGIPEKGECLGRVGRITIRMMLGGKSGHVALKINRPFVKSSSFLLRFQSQISQKP